MKKEALIRVSSIQDNNKKDNVEVVTPGKFYKKEDNYYVVYDETVLSGMEGTTTTFKINPSNNKFSLIRMGTTSTKMEFVKGREDVILYNTPYGGLELNISTNNIKMDIDECGGSVEIDYDMSVSGKKVQNTLLSIDIKSK